MNDDHTADEAGGLVLIADDDHVQARLLSHWLTKEGYEVARVEDGRACLDFIHEHLVDVVLLDVHMPKMDGLEALERLKRIQPHLPAIMLTGEQGVETIVRAMQLGAYDYVGKPVDRIKLAAIMRHAMRAHKLAMSEIANQRMSAGGSGFPGLLSEADAMKPVFKQMDRLSASDITVLIHGESGTGKELVANAIHQRSGRGGRGEFVAVNCAAIASSLQESELFGHEKGAFTGADKRRAGFFERANNGTLFLDEVAELSPELQAALLRVLQERTVRRVGGSEEIPVDVRVLAASHKSLAKEVEEGRFRQDLYYRLAVFELELPPLRDRSEDVPLLMRHFLDTIAREQGRETPEVSDSALRALASYSWPGNIRELRNAMQRSLVLADETVELDHLPPSIRSSSDSQETSAVGASSGAPASAGPSLTDASNAIIPLAELERRAILAAYRHTEGNVTKAGRLLGISRATLYRKLNQYGVLGDDD